MKTDESFPSREQASNTSVHPNYSNTMSDCEITYGGDSDSAFFS